MTSAGKRSRSGVLAVLMLIAGAALLAAGTLLRWWSVDWIRPVVGAQTQAVSGRDAAPALLALALVSLAGLAALAAVGGRLRRVLGALVTLLGLAAVWVSVAAAGSRPDAVVLQENPQVERIVDGSLTITGPVLSGLGGLLVAVAGVLALLGRFPGRGMGRRFDRAAPEDRSAADPDWWKQLDRGSDPT